MEKCVKIKAFEKVDGSGKSFTVEAHTRCYDEAGNSIDPDTIDKKKNFISALSSKKSNPQNTITSKSTISKFAIVPRDVSSRERDIPTLTHPPISDFKDVAKLKDAIQEDNFAIIKATRLSDGSFSSKINVDSNAKLKGTIIEEFGADNVEEIERLYKGVPDGPSFIVTNINKERALELGKEFGQKTILTSDGLVFSDSGDYYPNLRSTSIGQETDGAEFKSIIKGTDGKDIPFSVNINFDRKIKGNASLDHQINNLFAAAAEVREETHQYGLLMANKHGGTVTDINQKKIPSIRRKVVTELNENTHEVFDAVRNTVVLQPNKYNSLIADLRSQKQNMSILRIKEQSGPKFMGYSGIITNTVRSNGVVSETQFNTPEMIYAKEKEVDARRILGDQVFNDIMKKIKVKSGGGHDYYNQIRIILPKIKNETATDAEEQLYRNLRNASLSYYRKFRGFY